MGHALQGLTWEKAWLATRVRQADIGMTNRIFVLVPA